MELYWKGLCAALIAAMVSAALQKEGKDMVPLVALAGSLAVMLGAVYLLKPVISLLRKLQELGDFRADSMSVLLKAAGIALVTELGTGVCTDSGSAGLGKVLQILGTSAILWLSVPLIQGLLDLLQVLLGGN